MKSAVIPLSLVLTTICVAQPGMVGYWPFDDWAGPVAHDRFGNDAHCGGASPNWRSGRLGGAVEFQDNSSAMRVSGAPPLALTDTMTFSAWINGSLGGYFFSTHVINYKESSYYFSVSDGHVYGRIYTDRWMAVRGATRLDDNRWYHVAMTYDRNEGGAVTHDLGVFDGLRKLAGPPACADSSASASAAGALPAGWDTHHREIGNILYEPSDPNPDQRYKAWYTGQQGETYVQNQVYVGWYASRDGVQWTNRGQISSLALEDPYVVKSDGVYYMFAENKDEWLPAPPIGNIKRLHSTDLVQWIDDGNVLTALSGGTPTNWQAQDCGSPIVWIENGAWHMLYEARGAGNAGAIGLAHSSDGLHWAQESAPLVFPRHDEAWDGYTIVPDDLVKVDGIYHLFYHASGTRQIGTWSGLATSTDLHNWTRYAKNPFDIHATLMVLYKDGGFTFFAEDDGDGINRYVPVRVSAPRLFIDGVEDAYWQRADTNNRPVVAVNTEMTIGDSPSGVSYKFNGLIDELRIYDRVLGLFEIGLLASARAQTIPGDANCDGRVDNFDINAFVWGIVDSSVYQSLYPNCPQANCDVNGNGRVDNFDINSFVACVLDDDCP